MAKSWHYPRWRRVVMQLTMWVIFVATLGLAALVVHQKRNAVNVDLGAPRSVSNLSVRLPAKWTVAEGTADALFVAREPGRGGRELSIRRFHIPGLPSARQFLSTVGFRGPSIPIGEPDAIEEVQVDETEAQDSQLTIGKFPAAMVSVTGAVRLPMSGRFGRSFNAVKRIDAVAVLPSRQVVHLRLEGPGEPEPQDEALVRNVAASIELPGEPVPEKLASVKLFNGCELKVPENFLVAVQTDPNRIDRTLLLDRNDERLSITLIPCLYFPSDSPASIASMLTLRNSSLYGALVKQDAEQPAGANGATTKGWWRLELPGPDDKRTASGARMLTQADGRSVLCLFGGAPIDGPDFIRAYQTLLRSPLTTGGGPDYGACLTRGEAEAQRLSKIGLNELLGANRSKNTSLDEWWFWREIGNKRPMGWLHTRFDETVDWGVDRETRLAGGTTPLRILERWEGDAGLTSYRYESRRVETDATSPSYTQHTLFGKARLASKATSAEGTPLMDGAIAPQQYVPGGWLSMMIGRLDLSNGPLALRTDSMLNYQGNVIAAPMTVLVYQSEEPPKYAADEPVRLRCVITEISGTGEIIRWYFRPDGSLEQIEVPDNQVVVKTDPQGIKFEFSGDAKMMP